MLRSNTPEGIDAPTPLHPAMSDPKKNTEGRLDEGHQHKIRASGATRQLFYEAGAKPLTSHGILWRGGIADVPNSASISISISANGICGWDVHT